MSAGKKVTIELLPFRHVVIDDAMRGPGERVQVSSRDAETLVADGYARRVTAGKTSSSSS